MSVFKWSEAVINHYQTFPKCDEKLFDSPQAKFESVEDRVASYVFEHS